MLDPDLAVHVFVRELGDFLASMRVLHVVLPVSVKNLRPVVRNVRLLNEFRLICAVTAEMKQLGRRPRPIILVKLFACREVLRIRLIK